MMAHSRGGRVRVLAGPGENPRPPSPDPPPPADAGWPQYRHDGGWFGMFAPANTPADIINKLWREVHIAEQKPAVLEGIPSPGEVQVADSPAVYKNFKQAGIKAYAQHARMAELKTR